MPVRTTVLVEGRTVHLQAWRYEVQGLSGFTVPVYFLDADLVENTAWDRTLTHVLYGGDARYRLCQEVLLGMGGVKMLRALGYAHLDHFHMNEGHSSLLTLELLAERLTRLSRQSIGQDDMDAVRAQCVFTTHTPGASRPRSVPARSGTAGTGPTRGVSQPAEYLLLRRHAQHDLSRTQPQPLY